ncbi:GAF domain-containing protein, partial [Aeromonas hydrophila]|uniref:GAF domain-containing protein n=1 Tax=Aeromonas hydrophila TaxID=644 RepID=UPI003EC668AB
MQSPAVPDNERLRLDALRRLAVLDSPAEERFDRITRMARNMFNVPIALVSLVDENRQWFKSCCGLPVLETPRDISFCGHAILGEGLFVVEDAAQDPRFSDNPLVYGDGIHLTVAHKREWSYGFKPDNKTVPLPCYP